jgi:hypothetical protein
MSLVLTLMQPLRQKYSPNGIDKFNMKRSRYGALDFHQRQSTGTQSLVSDELRASIKKSMGNTIQIPVLDTDNVVITNTRSCTVQDSENTSRLITLSFVTYSFGFTMTPAQHFNNQISYQQDFDRKMEKYLIKFADTLDVASVNNLNLNRNINWTPDIAAYYPQVGNALQVTAAQRNDFYNQAEAVLRTMDFYGTTNVVSSTSGMPIVNRIAAQGGGNAVNEAFQLAGYEWAYTNRIINNAGVNSTLFLVADGAVGIENRNDPDAIMKSRVGNHKIWDEVNLPLVNMKVASYYYEDCADRSALHAGTSHLTRTKLEGYEFSTDVVYINSYLDNPATKYAPITKVELLA